MTTGETGNVSLAAPPENGLEERATRLLRAVEDAPERRCGQCPENRPTRKSLSSLELSSSFIDAVLYRCVDEKCPWNRKDPLKLP